MYKRQQYWYDGNLGGNQGKVLLDGTEVPVSVRRLGCAMLLVAPEELSEVVWLKKDGEKILWREGNDLINGERFFAQEQLCYSDAVTKSVNKRALAVYDYLARAHPEDVYKRQELGGDARPRAHHLSRPARRRTPERWRRQDGAVLGLCRAVRGVTVSYKHL